MFVTVDDNTLDYYFTFKGYYSVSCSAQNHVMVGGREYIDL